jgi:tetratricopeptide (TPR) repeat protein
MTTTIQQATALIRDGFDAQNRGESSNAEAQYARALRLVPEHPTALQLLGLLRKRQGDLTGAEDLMRRSLRALPAQPHVWNNLGNLLEDTQRVAEALNCFEQAVALDANYADGHYNRARLLLALGKTADAGAAAARAAASSTQPTAALLQLQSQIHAELNALPQALQAIDEALQLAPDKPALVHNKATLLQRSHRYAEALQAHDRALMLGLDVADAHYNRGNTLQSLGRLAEAQLEYRVALQKQPLHELALYDLARLRWRLGDADFDADLQAAALNEPASPLPQAIRAQLLWRAERHGDAAQAYREALRRAPETAGYLDALGRCLVRLGEVHEGLTLHRRATSLAPGDAGIRANFAASLLIARRPEEAEAEAAAALAAAPRDQYAWAVCGLAWRQMGDAREAWLNDYSRFVHAIDLEPPPGYADMASFNAELAAELESLHADKEAPLDQTLRLGTQTMGDIFEQGHPLVDALKQRIGQAVQRTVSALPTDSEHPFLQRRAPGWRFADSWSSRLRDRGFHTNHVHPHGWMSSAYYVSVPACCEDVQRREGWLQFGAPDFDIGIANAARLLVQPKAGRLVLFPSMFWHGTLPFSSRQPRLTVAFDVVPT